MSVAAGVPNDAEVMNPRDEVDDPAQIVTSLANIVLQLQKHVKQLGVHHQDANIAVVATTTPAKPKYRMFAAPIKQSQFVLQL